MKNVMAMFEEDMRELKSVRVLGKWIVCWARDGWIGVGACDGDGRGCG